MLKKIFNFLGYKKDSSPKEKQDFPKEIIPTVEEIVINNNSEPEETPKEKIENLSSLIKNYKEYCLEKTSNQHNMKVLDFKIIDKDAEVETFKISDDAFIFHNEHNIIRIESEYFVKYIQQEYNPLTRLLENAYD